MMIFRGKERTLEVSIKEFRLNLFVRVSERLSERVDAFFASRTPSLSQFLTLHCLTLSHSHSLTLSHTVHAHHFSSTVASIMSYNLGINMDEIFSEIQTEPFTVEDLDLNFEAKQQYKEKSQEGEHTEDSPDSPVDEYGKTRF